MAYQSLPPIHLSTRNTRGLLSSALAEWRKEELLDLVIYFIFMAMIILDLLVYSVEDKYLYANSGDNDKVGPGDP